MDYEKFNQLVTDLFDFFMYSKKPPEEHIMNKWYQHVQHVPNDAVNDIELQIASYDSMPRNIPKAIKTAWQKWVQDNPGKQAQVERTHCDDCNGNGFLIGKKKPEDYPHEITFMCRCASCQNWRREFGESIPSYTKAAFQYMGYQL